jgi:flagellar biosynthetic protein FliR
LALEWYFAPLIVFTLVLARVSGLVMTAPLLMSAEIPLQVRGFLTVAIAALLTPGQLTVPIDYPRDLAAYGMLIGGELWLGMFLGAGVMIILAGVQIAGQLISQLSGMSLADVFNPGFDSEVPLVAHLLYLTTLAVFLLIDGHRYLMGALLNTFATIPLGGGRMPATLSETIATLLTESFSLGIRAAAPAMVALLLATVLLGLISRTIPQINVMVVGFGVNSLITLGMLAISMSSMVYVFQDSFTPTIDELVSTLQTSAAATGALPAAER